METKNVSLMKYHSCGLHSYPVLSWPCSVLLTILCAYDDHPLMYMYAWHPVTV